MTSEKRPTSKLIKPDQDEVARLALAKAKDMERRLAKQGKLATMHLDSRTVVCVRRGQEEDFRSRLGKPII